MLLILLCLSLNPHSFLLLGFNLRSQKTLANEYTAHKDGDEAKDSSLFHENTPILQVEQMPMLIPIVGYMACYYFELNPNDIASVV